jgi:hypothetical protein
MRAKEKGNNALLAAYHARDVLDVVHDVLEIGLGRFRRHVFRNKVDLSFRESLSALVLDTLLWR